MRQPQAPKLPTTSSKLRAHVYRVLVYGGVIGACLLLGVPLVVQHFQVPNLSCIVYDPIQDPDGSGNRIQIILIRNSGSRPAEALELKIRSPQTSSLDYYIEGSRKPTSEARDNESLSLSVNSLPPDGFLIITIRIIGAKIDPSSVTASSREGTLRTRKIQSVTWEDAK